MSTARTHVPTEPTSPIPADPPALDPLTILPLTLGNVTEELERHWQAKQVVQEWDLEALHALLMLFFEPATAGDYGLIYHICSKETEVSGVPGPGLELGPEVRPTLPCSGTVLTGAAQLGLQLIHLLCGQAESASGGFVGLCAPSVCGILR